MWRKSSSGGAALADASHSALKNNHSRQNRDILSHAGTLCMQGFYHLRQRGKAFRPETNWIQAKIRFNSQVLVNMDSGCRGKIIKALKQIKVCIVLTVGFYVKEK